MTDSFKRAHPLAVGGGITNLESRRSAADKVARLPYSLKILLENLLRCEDGVNVTASDIEALLNWDAEGDAPTRDRLHAGARAPAGFHRRALRGRPGRDARRGAEARRRSEAASTRWSRPNWSSTTRCRSTTTAPPTRWTRNTKIEFERNGERYAFLRWGQKAFETSGWCRRTPASCTRSTSSTWPRRVRRRIAPATRRPIPTRGRHRLAHHDDQRPRRAGLGRRRHRGRGGDARPAGHDADPAGGRLQADRQAARRRTATDLVLTVTEMLRKKGVVDKFVEFFGDGLANLPLADRATIANMAPEYGAPAASSRSTTRRCATSAVRPPAEQIALVEAYAKAQGLWRYERRAGRRLHRHAGARPRHRGAAAWPARSARRTRAAAHCRRAPIARHCKPMAEERTRKNPAATGSATVTSAASTFELKDGAVVIAAITSCTNTSNPAVMLAAGLWRARRVAGPDVQAVGQDQPGAGLARGHRLPHQGRPAGRPGGARLQRRRLRLHHLHRQLRPAASRRSRRA